MRKYFSAVLVLAASGLPGAAEAYIGPGAGLSAIGSLLALIGAVLLAIVGFVWYPVRRLLRRGKDAVIIALGSMVAPALQAADILGKSDISVEVVDARFVKPLDIDMLQEKARMFKAVITVEDGVVNGGFGTQACPIRCCMPSPPPRPAQRRTRPEMPTRAVTCFR